MIPINEYIFSEEILEKHFCCNLEACKGACCTAEGFGAPLEKEEADLMPALIPVVSEYLPEENIQTLRQTNGLVEIDQARTPLMPDGRCAYVFFEGKTAKCAIEKAFYEGKTDFIKPVSCHLYPIRLKKYESFTAVNFEYWKICKPARICGKQNHVSLLEFCKNALIRRFGKEIYQQLSDLCDKK